MAHEPFLFLSCLQSRSSLSLQVKVEWFVSALYPPLSNSLNSHNAPVRKPHIPFCSVEMQENTHRHTHTLKSLPYRLWHHVCVRFVLTRSLATAQSLQLRNKLQHMDLYIHVCLRAALCMCKRVCVRKLRKSEPATRVPSSQVTWRVSWPVSVYAKRSGEGTAKVREWKNAKQNEKERRRARETLTQNGGVA